MSRKRSKKSKEVCITYAKNGTSSQHSQAGSKDVDGNRTDEPGERRDHCGLGAKPLRRPTVNEKTNDTTCARAITEGRLPLCGNNVFASSWIRDTETFEE